MSRLWLRKHSAIGVSALAAFIAACSSSDSPTCSVSQVSVSPTNASVVAGQTTTLSAAVTQSHCSPSVTATWSSSNTSIATVSAGGVVTGVAPGSATITASASGLVGSAAVTVTPAPVASITLAPAQITTFPDSTRQITATPRDGAGNALTGRTVTWTSSAASVATVSSSGLVTALTAGSATITAASEGITANVAVTVNPRPVASIDLGLATREIEVNGTNTVTATTRASNGDALTGRTIAWASSNTSIATVSSTGVITGVALGTATITATSEGVTSNLPVTVFPVVTEDQRVAYVWANLPSAALDSAYVPSTSYSFNGAGGPIRVVRVATGRYTVSFGRMAKFRSPLRESMFVSAYGNDGARCAVLSWNTTNGTELTANVSCVSLAGTAADTRFDLLMIGSNTLEKKHAFFWNSSASATSGVSGSYAYSSMGGTESSTYNTTGSYTGAFGLTSVTRSNVQVAAYGGTAFCRVSIWNEVTGSSNLSCFGNDGTTGVDTRYTAAMLESGRAGKRWGFVWAHQLSATLNTPYTPSVTYQSQSNSQPVSITRTAVGQYTVTFTGLARVSGSTETMIVSAYGAAQGPCQINGWGNSGSDLVVSVSCWSLATAARVDAQFSFFFIE